MNNLVFVYGILQGSGELVESNYSIRATCYDLGSYPGITALGGDRLTYGELIRVTDDTLRRFDRIEGIESGLYRREIIHTSHGNAFVYVYNREVINCPPISRFIWETKF